MTNKKILYLAMGVAVASIISVLAIINNNDGNIQKFSGYDDANKILKQELLEYDISMSSPIKLQRQEDVQKYCTFFTSEEQQNLVQYCTSTELKDNDGKFLGNVHMVGSSDEPKIILVLVQVDSVMSQIDSVKNIVDTTIQNLVCDCWNQVRPDGFEDVGQWVDGLRQFHLQDTKPHSKSKEITLSGQVLQLELTTNKDGYLWQFFVY
ncbi:MAG TPA: hypothetical protein VGA92_04885 [Candidatus Nitrosotenuis sp.]